MTEDDSDGNVTFTKSPNNIIAATVANVNIKRQQANDWSGKREDLPVKTADGGVIANQGSAGAKTIVFTYETKSSVSCAWDFQK